MKRVTEAGGVLAVACCWAIQTTAAQTMSLPFATKTPHGTTGIVVPKCGAIAGNGMNCELLTVTVIPQQAADGAAEQCLLLMSSEAARFRPTDGRTRVGTLATPICRSTTTLTLSRLDSEREPNRPQLRVEFSIADPSAECRSAAEQAHPLVFDWEAGKPIKIDHLCRELPMGPGATPRLIVQGP